MDNKFETEVLTRLAVIESKLDRYTETEQKANDAYQKATNCEMQMNELKENNRWLKRAVIGAIITSVFTIITSIFLLLVEKGVGLK